MNTSALKTFAPAVRRSLQEAVSRKLDVVLAAQSPDYRTTFAPQVAALRAQATADRDELVERVAYTWFNRFIALRYLDARGWHPFNARVLTPTEIGATQPEILKLMREGALPEPLHRFTDVARLDALLDCQIPSTSPQPEVYRQLVLASCRFYHALLPNLFERLDDATELLLPDDLLTEQSVVAGFRSEITDEDCADVEVLGWLYQFYISEKKDEVMARKSAVPAEDIPAVTQLFTPHWIVRYLVENSLGRLWLLNRPGSRLREQMPYYIEGEPDTEFLRINRPEEIRVCDPAVGSGHMLTYAFDLLYSIYEEEGYAPTEIPALILQHNLFGLEICPRAAQLAELALVFKARERSRRYFQAEHPVRPHIIELRDVRFADAELRDYVRALDVGALFNAPLIELLHQFEEAKYFGSLIQPCLDERAIADARRAIEAKDLGGQLFLSETNVKVLRALEQADALTQRYHVVVANPPYMGKGAMDADLRRFGESNYSEFSGDLFTMFMKRNCGLAKSSAYVGMVTMQSWMFISTYDDMRRSFFPAITFKSLLHLGARAFDSITGEIVQTVAFVLANKESALEKTWVADLTTGKSEAEKDAALLNSTAPTYECDVRSLHAISAWPLAYWIGSDTLGLFKKHDAIADYTFSSSANVTGNNAKFLRYVWEVPQMKVTANEPYYWLICAKGGEMRKWYGNLDMVILWTPEAHRYYGSAKVCRFVQREHWGKCGITWSRIASSKNVAFRLLPPSATFETAGMTIFPVNESDTMLEFLLGFLNSNIARHILRLLNPTLTLQMRDVLAVPTMNPVEFLDRSIVIMNVNSLCATARADWDNFETSWDFSDQPLLKLGLKGATLEASWRNWEVQCTAAIRRMQQLETENNRIFITAYGLNGELIPEVPEEQITLARADARKDTAAFLSYAVGCMMGRYSLDLSGLILANAGDSLRDYLAKVERSQDQLTFAPDEDGIIPVLDGEWFEDDIVARTRDFLRATFGDAMLRENLRFIEDSLGKDLRKYFLTDFYKDHLQTYKKRPIYWMVQSPKKGFSALVYLHRYTRDTLNVVLNRYLREYQGKLRSRLAQLAQSLAGDDLTARDRTASRKEQDRLTKVLRECGEWEREVVLPLAQQRIPLDLDDGVKVNYVKLGSVLAPIAGLAAADE